MYLKYGRTGCNSGDGSCSDAAAVSVIVIRSLGRDNTGWSDGDGFGGLLRGRRRPGIRLKCSVEPTHGVGALMVRGGHRLRVGIGVGGRLDDRDEAPPAFGTGIGR